MDYWCDSFDLRNPLLVILVHSTIKDKQEIPMPVFQHSPHELLWSHSISCHLLPHWPQLVHMGSQRKYTNHCYSLCCKFTFFFQVMKENWDFWLVVWEKGGIFLSCRQLFLTACFLIWVILLKRENREKIKASNLIMTIDSGREKNNFEWNLN